MFELNVPFDHKKDDTVFRMAECINPDAFVDFIDGNQSIELIPTQWKWVDCGSDKRQPDYVENADSFLLFSFKAFGLIKQFFHCGVIRQAAKIGSDDYMCLFLKSGVMNTHFFKAKGGKVFVSDKFKKQWETAGLIGAEFRVSKSPIFNAQLEGDA